MNSECIEWTGKFNSEGRAYVSVSGKSHAAARIVWLASGREIPAGNEICHSCDNPKCVNIEHLYAATHSQNMMDAKMRGRLRGQNQTTCKNGHARTDGHVYVKKSGRRVCKECQKIWNRRYYIGKHGLEGGAQEVGSVLSVQ
jgi:hypothetical protein